MNAADVQEATRNFAMVGNQDIAVCNIFFKGFEMDVACVKRSGYLYEYEIKISRSDFFNDFKKYRPGLGNTGTYREKKHELIEKGQGVANRFFFVVPEGMITPKECPDYAGLIYVKEPGTLRSDLRVVQKARMLHKEKFDLWAILATKLYYREMRLRYKNRVLTQEVEILRNQTKEYAST